MNLMTIGDGCGPERLRLPIERKISNSFNVEDSWRHHNSRTRIVGLPKRKRTATPPQRKLAGFGVLPHFIERLLNHRLGSLTE